MKTLGEMSNAELLDLMSDVERAIRTVQVAGYSIRELATFRNLIDNELDRRGA